jgi:hypothetical protein
MTAIRIIKGLATYIPGFLRIRQENSRGSVSARYCYCVWLRHMVLAHRNGMSVPPRRVAELGPGDSLGVGLAALLSGADTYLALDVVRYAQNETNLVVFEELVRLFQKREPIPGDIEYPKVQPKLESYDFPHHILGEAQMAESLSPRRLDAIRKALSGHAEGGPVSISYHAPWHDLGVVRSGAVDMIFSQAVLEYVPDLEQTYRAMNRWLCEGGFASLAIDYQSHGTADTWDGHWTYSGLAWRLMRGKRPYGLNRQPHSAHARQLEKAGFEIVGELRSHLDAQTPPKRLARAFRDMPAEDRTTNGAVIQARKSKEYPS